MTALRVITPGLQSSIQDLGRPGFASLGVAPSGAADHLSLRIANRLVGNPDHSATIECTLSGDTFRAEGAARVALAGADASPLIRRAGSTLAVPLFQPFTLLPGDELVLGPILSGCRLYLAIAGGVDTPPVLASRSAHLAAAFPNLTGRPLREGDSIPIGAPTPPPRSTPDPASLRRFIAAHSLRTTFRVLPGPDAALIPPEHAPAIFDSHLTVSARSSRVGVRLVGGPACTHPPRTSEPTPPGAVQRTPEGELILLGPERPVTGGYPLVASVIAADIPAIGQLRPGARARLAPITLDAARTLLIDQQQALDALLPPLPA
ncbi:MAG: biotin-dependent carboxyltransferase family protein [Phycisphaerales bacterium]|nr:biotin-dependent carboxyltransferase family protein [Phycisphaerales bacterium]